MGLGLKRNCYSCDAKFYDLEKDPAICPKCGSENLIDGDHRTKEGRKALVQSFDEEKLDEIDIELDGDEIESLEDLEDDDDISSDLGTGIRSKRDDDDESTIREKAVNPDKNRDDDEDDDDIDLDDDEDEEEEKK